MSNFFNVKRKLPSFGPICPSGQAGIHMNPVEEGLVFKPEDYVYSSAADYAGDSGLLDVLVIK